MVIAQCSSMSRSLASVLGILWVAGAALRCTSSDGTSSDGAITLAAGQHPGAIAVDATNVYWTNTTEGTVVKCAVAGCGGAPTILASGQSGLGAIATDGTSVYWTNGSDGTVMRCAVGGCGGNPTLLASGQQSPGEIAVDATSVYWTNGGTPQNSPTPTSDGTVMKCARDGGIPTLLASGQTRPRGIAVDAANVYWSADKTVMKVPVGGGDPTKLASASGQAILSIAVDAANVYWTEYVNGGNVVPPQHGDTVMKVPIGGGDPITIASGQAAPTGIVVDGTSVYWANNGGTITKCAIGGCGENATTLASPSAAGPALSSAIAVDATSVYWTERLLTDATGEVMKMTPK